jgi:hypothetical protein
MKSVLALLLLSLVAASEPAGRKLEEQATAMAACTECENQMFDCSDMCNCAWGGADIMQCMLCNSKCTAKKCAAYCEAHHLGGQ